MGKASSSTGRFVGDMPATAALRNRSLRFSLSQIEHIEKIFQGDPSVLARLAILKRLAPKPRSVSAKSSVSRLPRAAAKPPRLTTSAGR